MVTGIILSGGTGVRLGGDIPKQYIEVDGKPIILDSIIAFERHQLINKIVIVAANEWREYIRSQIEAICDSKFSGFADPGENRQLSILNALYVVKEYSEKNDIVIIHDAARPFVTDDAITELVDACKDHDGAMPALPVKDTMYISKDGRVKSLIDRDSLVAGQAPEAFVYGKYLLANEALLPDRILSIKGSTEPAFMAGMDVAIIKGDENNFKITTREDLNRYIKIKSEQ